MGAAWRPYAVDERGSETGGAKDKFAPDPAVFLHRNQQGPAVNSEARQGQKRHFDAGRWRFRLEKGFFSF